MSGNLIWTFRKLKAPARTVGAFRLSIKSPDRNRIKLFEGFKETFSRKSFFNGFQGEALTSNTRKNALSRGHF